MSEQKTRAAMWVTSCALYMLSGELLRQSDIRLGALSALLVGMFCAAQCFSCGRAYERERQRESQGEACEDERSV